MIPRQTQITGVVLSALLVLSAVAFAFAAGAGATADPSVGVQELTADDDVLTDDFPTGTAQIQDNLLDDADDGPVTAVVRVVSADQSRLSGDRETVVDKLQAHATATQQSVLALSEEHENIEALNTFWISNAVLVETDASGLRTLAEADGVDRIHSNFEFTQPEVQSGSVDDSDISKDDVSYGLDQMDVPEARDQFDVTGEGVTAAVLDSGLSPNHPDIADRFPSDNWAEFDANGNPVNSTPFDNRGHGTNVGGIVGGSEPADTSIPQYGVAPGVEFYGIKVLDDTGSGTFTQINAGLQFVANQTDIDIAAMSFGSGAPNPGLIESINNMVAAGIIPSASIGNSGAGTSGSPGDYYSVLGSGAIDSNEEVAGFSAGQNITVSSAFPGAPIPGYWEDEYLQPDATAAGVSTITAAPSDGYASPSGTSFSQPHKAGMLALMLDALDTEISGWADIEPLYDAIRDTAREPDVSNPPELPNNRYGHGVVDAPAVLNSLDLGPEVPEFDVGDVNEDGERSIVDAVLVQQFLAGMNVSINENLADVDRNGEIDIVDAVLLQQFLAGIADDASAEVSNLSAPTEGAPGEQINVSATVENTGSIGTVQGIEFRLAGATVATNVADLSPAGTENSSLVSEYQITVPNVPGGEYTHGVFSDDDNETATITVLNSFFDVTGLDAPTEVARGNQITVNATIENVGNEPVTQDVEFRFAGSTLLTEENVSLDGGESTTVTFEPTVDVERGTYEHGVFTENDSQTANITVVEPEFLVNDVSGPTSVVHGDEITVNATVTNNGTAADQQTIEYGLGAAGAGDRVLVVAGENEGAGTEPIDQVIQSIIQDQLGSAVQVDTLTPWQGDLLGQMDNYDVFVLHRFGEDDGDSAGDSLASDFYSQLSSTQATVHLDTRTGGTDSAYPSAIRRSNSVRSVPATYQEDGSGIEGQPIEIVQDHPLWTGIGAVGDEVDMNTGDFIGDEETSAFDGYDGTTIGNDVTSGLSSVAVDDNPDAGLTEILLTNTGPNFFTNDRSRITQAAETLIGNAVEFAAFDQVGGNSAGTNSGHTETVQLDPGESTSVSFNYTVTPADGVGDIAHVVSSEDDEASQQVTVTAPDQIDVTDLRAPGQAEQFDQITVEADLEHVGTEQTTQQVDFSFAGSVLLSQNVTLSPGDTTTVSFQPQIPANLAPGTYEHGVTVTYDEAFANIEITEADPANMDVSGFDGPVTAEQGETINVSATIENTGEKPGEYLGEYVFDGEVVDNTAPEGVVPPLDVVVVDTHDPDEDPSDPSEDSKYYAPALADIITGQTSSDLIGSVDALNVEQDDLVGSMSDYDVFVIQRFNSDTRASDFLDNLSTNQAVIYLGGAEGFTDEAYPDSIDQLVTQSGDPTTYTENVTNEEFEIAADHPVFDGVGSVGDVISMSTNLFAGDGAGFIGYSGTTLGLSTSTDEGDAGVPVIGVSDNGKEILSGVSGWTFSSDADSEWSSESKTMLGNMVSHVGDTIAADTNSLAPGESVDVSLEYTVPQTQQPGQATHGVQTADAEDTDTVRVVRTAADLEVTGQNVLTESHFVNDTLLTRATVVNNGDATGSLDVSLFFDGSPVNTTTVELGPGEVTTVDLTATFSTPGDYIVSVNGVSPTQISVGAVGNADGTVTASGDTVSSANTPAGEGIEGATVTVFPFDTSRSGAGLDIATTDANGTYEALDVPAGTHGVEISAPNFETFAGTVTVPENGTVTTDVALDYAEAGSISGELTLDPSDPTEDTTVTVTADDGATTFTETVQLNGSTATANYTISGVDVDVGDGYTVTATASGYDDATAENVTVEVGADTGDVDLTLTRETGNVTGAVEVSGDTTRDTTGVPGTGEAVENATLLIYPFDPAGTSTPLVIENATDENGTFTVPGLPIGDHGVEIAADGFTTAGPLTVPVQTDQTTDVGTVALDYASTGSIEGTVSLGQPAGSGGVDVTISVAEANQGAFITIPEGDTSRSYSVGKLDVNVDAGYTVTAESNGLTDTVSGVEVEPNEVTTGVDFTIESEIQGTELSFSDQALGIDENGNAVVNVEDIQQGNLVSPDATDPSEDFVVLLEGETLTREAIVDVARIEDAENGQLVLEAEGATPGTHTVQIHEDLRAEGFTGNSDVPVDVSDSSLFENERTADPAGEDSYLLVLDEQPEVSATTDTQAAVSQMKTAAADAQAPVISSLDSMDVTVQQQFWIVNAVLVETGNGVSQADLQSVSGVERVYENAEYQQPGPAGDDSTGEISVDNNHEYTYGLRQIGVPSFDDTYNTTGQGTDVAILDDGVSDPDNLHPDLDFATKAIAENGEVTTGTLGSPDNGHGEHVAGTAVGSLEPAGDVPRYSVAPGANLHKINVFQGGAFTSDLVAAVQFSASNGYDVASMSLGFPALDGLSTIQPPMERAMQNADDLGAIVVGSAGNSGSGAAGGPVTSPGAEFSGFSIGASNNARDIAAFSSGAVVTPNNAVVFENSTYSDRVPYPDTYPREFIKPDVSAPGVGVLSAGPLGTNVASNPTYSTSSGTSMAAPHVAGAVALVQSATSVEHSPEAIRNALVETAEKPADAPTVTNERDIRYGAGIINVTAATMALQDGTTALSGEVTDASTGDGLTGAKLTTDTNVVTSTENGNYITQVTADTPNVTVTADEFGYTAETQTVDNDGVATADFALSPEVAVDPVVGQPTFTTFQSNFSIVADVRNLEEYTVELVDATGVSEADLSVSVAGNAATFGQPLALGGVSADDVPVTVEVDGQFNEGDEFSLEHTFAGPGDDVVVTTGPTTLTETIGPPAFELSNFTAPDGQALGQAEPYAAAVTITNTGQQTGTATAEWFLGQLGVAGSNPTANLAPGESQRVSLNFGDINVGAFFGGLPVGLVQGFEATPANPDGSGDVTVKTFDVGSGAFSLFDPFGAERVGETATVFDGSVSMTDQQFEDSTSEITVDTSDLQPAGASDYVIVVHNQTGVPAGGVGPPIGFSGNLTGAETNVTVPLSEEITQTTPLLAMIHFPGNPAGTPIPTFSSGAFGISDGQAGTVTDTAEMSIFSAEGAALDFGSQALGVDGQGNAVVYVDNITEAEQVEQTDVTNPADDFVVLFEGEQQVASNVVDFAPIADAQNGELTLEAENTNPGTHTVEIFANVSSEFDPTDGSQSTQTGGPQSAQAADQLADASGETTVILLVDRNIERSLITSGEVSSAELQRDSELTMQPVKSQINQLAAAEIQREYWVGNAMSVEIDLDQSDLSALTGIPGVSSVVPNVQLELPPQPTLETGAGSDELGTDGITPGLEPGNFTYGLQKIGIPSFEQQFETDGEGATVAIIDDGISNPEAGHPDLDIAQRAIAVDGSITEGTLGSPGAHGEHVAGTATGAADPAGEIPRYGVAPNASLIKVNAFEGGAFLNDILAGVQYSVAQDADVAGMSLGFPPTNDRNPMINAVDRAMKDANAAGTLVSVSAGNSGNFDQGGPVTSPAPEFGAFSVGASFDNPVNVPEIPASIIPSNTGSNNDIVFFSSGGVISERTAVESFEYPDTYPRQYVQPDVSAPGAIVISAGPLGSTPPSLSDDAATYSYSSGTSMAQPHVAGAVALVQSATSEDLGPKQIEAALVETAEKPADASELFRSIGNRDIRYGTGIINVTAAALAAQTENLAVSGTVSGPGGEAVVGATVESADGSLTNTDENGTFTLQTTAPDTSITVDAFGFEPATVNVSASGATSDQVQISEDVQLDRDLEVVPADPPTGVVGDSFDISVDVGSLESFTLELSDTADVTASEINVSSNLGPVSLGETLNFSNLTGTIVLTVDLTADVDLGDRITFEHSFTGVGDEITVTTSTLSVPPLDQPRGAAETANVLAADVAIDNQSFEGSTSEVTVSTSSVLPDDEEYVIVVHNVTDGGLPIVGNSGVLTGAQDNVTIPIDTLETTTDVLAMLHFAEGGTFVAPITAFDPAAGAPVPVTDTAIVEIEQTGNFTVNGLSPQSATVNKSETFDVSATVENVGDTQGTQPVELRLEPDGAAVASQSVQLAPGENTTVSFENVSVGTPGVYNHTVASSDDRATGDLTVQSLANFEVSNLSAPAAADNNEQITVNATISNTGDQAGTQDVLFQLDGDGNFDSPAVSVVAAENLTLAGGASQQAEITVETPSENGVFEHGLFTNDDNQTAEITVGNPQVVASLSDESGAVGENVTSAFTIDGFDGQEDVSGYDVEIEFDPSVIEFVQVTEVDTTPVIVNDEDVDNGVLGLTFVSAAPVSTPLTAVEIEFTVVGSGDSSLTFNETNSDVQGPGGAALNPVFEDGSVSSTGSTALNSATVWTAPPV